MANYSAIMCAIMFEYMFHEDVQSYFFQKGVSSHLYFITEITVLRQFWYIYYKYMCAYPPNHYLLGLLNTSYFILNCHLWKTINKTICFWYSVPDCHVIWIIRFGMHVVLCNSMAMNLFVVLKSGHIYQDFKTNVASKLHLAWTGYQ